MIQNKYSALFISILIFFSCSCSKLSDYNQKPELSSLRQGIKTSAAVGYCSSLAMTAFKGQSLPENVTMVAKESDNYSQAWLLYVKLDSFHPLPFNKNVGDILIAGIGDAEGGVISILFGDFNLLNNSTHIYGIQTVPVIERKDAITGEKKILAVFAKEDIIVKSASSDSFLNMNLPLAQFNIELNRCSSSVPSDTYVAVKQNVWFVDINRAETCNSVYDDIITINGGGQIIETNGISGGVIYHAMINTKLDFSACTINPVSGLGFSQNFKTGSYDLIDLGNSILSFHRSCDGLVHVDFSCGHYAKYNGKSLSLDIDE
jgi:hypothetical protein